HAEILAAETAPAWVQDRAALWNAVETAETRRNAQLARELVLTLPRELTPEQRLEAVRSFVSAELVSRGMVADLAIHSGRTARDGAEQPHAHVMLTLRAISPEGLAGNKVRAWNEVAALERWREQWGACLNQALEHAELSARVDHRSLEAQRQEAERMADQARTHGHTAWADQFTLRALELDRRPEPKLGVAARLEARGITTEQGALVREVRAEREERRSLGNELGGWLTGKGRTGGGGASACVQGCAGGAFGRARRCRSEQPPSGELGGGVSTVGSRPGTPSDRPGAIAGGGAPDRGGRASETSRTGARTSTGARGSAAETDTESRLGAIAAERLRVDS